jgi:hypothetical protein
MPNRRASVEGLAKTTAGSSTQQRH